MKAFRHDPTSSAQMQVLETLSPSDKKLIRRPKRLNPSKQRAANSYPSKNIKEEVTNTDTTRIGSTIRIEVQNYIDYLRAKFEAARYCKEPNMRNTRKSITNIKKGKDRDFRSLKTTTKG